MCVGYDSAEEGVSDFAAMAPRRQSDMKLPEAHMPLPLPQPGRFDPALSPEVSLTISHSLSLSPTLSHSLSLSLSLSHYEMM